jgi:hypothetical protein
MPTALERYRQLRNKLDHIREVQGENSNDEESVLDEMDDVWYELTHEEIEALNSDPPRPGDNGPEKE